MKLTYTEAPYGVPLDGLIEPGKLPNSICVLARPNMRNTYPFALDVLRSLGHDRFAPGKGKATSTRMTLATAWALTHRVTDVYVGEAQELGPRVIEEIFDFAARIGSGLCLIFGFGQIHARVSLLDQYGASFVAYDTLPRAITDPVRSTVAKPTRDSYLRSSVADLPGDDWMTFRAAYLEALNPEERQKCEFLYQLTMARTAERTPTTAEEVCQIISATWARNECSRQHRIVAIRAAQAELFRQGWNMKVDLNSVERFITNCYLNPLKPSHYQLLRTYADPWRAAATILDAHLISAATMLALRAKSVSVDGSIADLDITEDAKPLLIAQRWAQLLGSRDPDPPLFTCSPASLRAAIRRTTAELDLPIYRRRRLQDDERQKTRIGLSLERLL